MTPEELSGRRVVVWGAGREGSAAATLCQEVSAAETVYVEDSTETEGSEGSSLGPGGLPVLQGRRALDALERAEVLVLSPGVSRYRPEVLEAEKRGVAITSGTALYLAEHAHRTIGVTGSKGKSTTTRLAHCLLSALGEEVSVGGNLGTPLLEMRENEGLVVAEISSYQAALVQGGPRISLLTALFPDHLPWHGDKETYYKDKTNLLRRSGESLVNGKDPEIQRHLHLVPGAKEYAGERAEVSASQRSVHYRGEAVLHLPEQIVGEHNTANVAGAMACLVALGHDVLEHRDLLQGALDAFVPLPHRLETVVDARGVQFVDDALATTPQASRAACESYPESELVLIVGGKDRYLEYSSLTTYLSERARRSRVAILPLGSVGRAIAEKVEGAEHLPEEEDLERAAWQAGRAAESWGGGIVLLSPAAASSGAYQSYLERAAAFRRGAEKWARQAEQP